MTVRHPIASDFVDFSAHVVERPTANGTGVEVAAFTACSLAVLALVVSE